jgi:hypothetical protein
MIFAMMSLPDPVPAFFNRQAIVAHEHLAVLAHDVEARAAIGTLVCCFGGRGKLAAQGFGMQLRGRHYTQHRLGPAIVLVEQLVGEIVGPSEDEVGIEGAVFAEIDASADVSAAVAR